MADSKFVYNAQVKPKLLRSNSRSIQEQQQYVAEDKAVLHQQYEQIRNVLAESCQHAINAGKLPSNAKDKFVQSGNVLTSMQIQG